MVFKRKITSILLALLTGSILLLMGIVLDAKPLWVQFSQAQHQIAWLKKKVHRQRKEKKHSVIKTDMVSVMSNVAQECGLAVQTIRLSKVHNDVNRVHIMASGSFSDFIRMLTLLLQQPFSIVLEHFSLRAGSHSFVQIDAYFFIFPQKFFSPKPVSLTVNEQANPFHIVNKEKIFELTDVFQSESSDLQSWRQYHVAGYFTIDKTRWAVMQLPNTKSILVRAGSFIGSEHAKVLKVNEKEIGLQVNGQIYHLRGTF